MTHCKAPASGTAGCGEGGLGSRTPPKPRFTGERETITAPHPSHPRLGSQAGGRTVRGYGEVPTRRGVSKASVHNLQNEAKPGKGGRGRVKTAPCHPSPPFPRGAKQGKLQAPKRGLRSQPVCGGDGKGSGCLPQSVCGGEGRGIRMLSSPNRRTFFPEGSLERERVDTSLRMQDLARRDDSA